MLFQLIFYAGILTQIATQGLQYFNAVGRHKVLDREFAYALFAYTRDDPKLLREFAKETPYVTGYRLFKDVPPRLEEAKVYFNKSITKRQFVASSHYMLGTIERMQHPNDFKRARKEFDEAIKADEEYAASYYGRAITELMGTERDERDAALKDLSMALIYEEGDLICLTINSETELKMYWERAPHHHRRARLALATPISPSCNGDGLPGRTRGGISYLLLPQFVRGDLFTATNPSSVAFVSWRSTNWAGRCWRR